MMAPGGSGNGAGGLGTLLLNRKIGARCQSILHPRAGHREVARLHKRVGVTQRDAGRGLYDQRIDRDQPEDIRNARLVN